MSSNVLWNVLGALAQLSSGFLTLPFLIKQLGAEVYGIWILVSVVVAYLALLDFGVSFAVGRLVVKTRLCSAGRPLNSVISTGFGLLTVVSLIVVAATVTALDSFPVWFNVPEHKVNDVLQSLLVYGIATAVWLPLLTIDAVLWGYERFDIINASEIAEALARVVLLLVYVEESSPLMTLVLINVVVHSVAYMLRYICILYVGLPTRIHWSYWSNSIVKEICLVGGWYNALTLGRALSPQVPLLAIGNALGPAAVGLFAIPRQLVGFESGLVQAIAKAPMARAAKLHYGQDHSEQRHLFLFGGKMCSLFSLLFLSGFLCFGGPFLKLWQPTLPDLSYDLLVVMAAGEALPISQSVTISILLAIGEHKRLAILSFVEALILLIVGVVSFEWFGLFGATVSIALIALVLRGVVPLVYGCRATDVRVGRYLSQVILPLLGISVAAVMLFLAASPLLPLDSWVGFLATGAVYSCLYIGCSLLALYGPVAALTAVRGILVRP